MAFPPELLERFIFMEAMTYHFGEPAEDTYDLGNGTAYSNVIWHMETPPTEEEFDAKIEEYREYRRVNIDYKENKLEDYPSLREFADAYYWEKMGDSTKMDEWVANCTAVKTKYPKP